MKYTQGSIKKIIIEANEAFSISDLGFYVTVVPYKGEVKEYHIWDYEIKDLIKKLKEKRLVK